MSKESFRSVWESLTEEHREHLRNVWEKRAAREGIALPAREGLSLVDYVWEIHRILREKRQKGE